MKNVLFPKVITIFKLIYLLWFKIEQAKEKNYTAAALEITVEHRTLNDQKFENARM